MSALVVADGPSAGRRVEVEGELVLGRDHQAFLQDDPDVSPGHAAVRSMPGGLEIRDLGTASGTWVNGNRIADRAPLSSGDVVVIGRTSFQVVVGEPAEPRSTEEPVMSRAATAASQMPPSHLPPPEVTPADARAGPAGATAFVLVVTGLVTGAYAVYVLAVTLRDFPIARVVGLGGTFVLIAVIAALLLGASVAQAMAGARFRGYGPGVRALGRAASFVSLAMWAALLAVLFTRGAGPNTIGWIALVPSVLGSITSLVLISVSRRSLGSEA